MAIISSCGDEDPLPAPLPAFEATTDLEVFEIGLPIEFRNNSTNASTYSWDFGDGSALSTDINPEHTYQEPGTYTVILTATTEDEQSDSTTMQLEVGQRELTSIIIFNISFDNLDAQGNLEGPWDVGSGPDIVILFGPADDANFESTVVTQPNPDVAEPFVPFGFTLNEPLPLTDEEWSFAMLDDDSDIEAGAFDLMIQTQGFNPITNSNSFVNPDTKEGQISVSGGGFEIIFEFQID